MNNPILQFENKRILTSARKTLYSRIRSGGYAALVILTLLAIGALLLFPNVPLMPTHQVSFIAVLGLFLQTVLSLMLLQRTLLRATVITGRERTSTWNWEAFVLTGMDAHTVIMGKWNAVVSSLWREFLLLGIIRAAIFPVGMMLHRIHSEYPYIAPGQYALVDFIPPLPNLLFGLAAVALLTFAQLPLIAAIGVLAASRRSTQPAGFGRALSTWLLVSMGTAVIIGLTFFAYNQYVFYASDIASMTYHSWLAVETNILYTAVLSAVTVADTAILSPFALITSILYPENLYWLGFVSVGLVLAIYGFLTWAALRLSIRLSRWQGMVNVNSR